ncbi:Two-component sensor histidine kinase, contains HisKA and HATPase domains [Consotaella salsifontis]|uniref:histidine kinase n=2 Tax=Consotaella salsifontis TaxID=1365950 RepID=A0A1T4NMU8_9HYPH|nr:Two-component sensor histidine kinase, contains HisKA and HATPase domains [Consotaella salsifontis]
MTNGAQTRANRSSRRFRWFHRPPLRVYLAFFALLVLVPALLFSAYLIVQFSRQQEQLAAGQVADTAVIVSNAIDREIYGMLTAANVLASSPFLDEEDLSRFHERTRAALANADAVLVNPQMQVVLNTRQPFPMEPAPVAYADAIEKAFQTRTPQISDVYYGPNADDMLFHVAVPVIRRDEVVYVLVVNRPAESLGSLLTNRTLPEAWAAVVKDNKGRRVFAALSSSNGIGIKEVAQENPSVAETLRDEHRSMIEASQTSFLTGWTTTVGVPRRVIEESASRSWMMLVGAGTILAVFCLSLAVLFGRTVATPILRLSHQAAALGRGEPAMPIRTRFDEIGTVSRALARASRERREAEEQNRLLMREMTHRAKNQYALIAAIARRAARESNDASALLETLSQALSSLARSADLLAGKGWESAPLADLIATQLAAFGAGDGGSEQFIIGGPKVWLNPSAAQTIGLALHELATNAAKYGALSVAEGRVEIAWTVAGEEFAITWRETGGPPVAVPRHQGFGSLVVKKMTARGLGGDVLMDFAPSGVVWRLTAPLESVSMS